MILHACAEKGIESISFFSLRNGANVNSKDDEGYTALMVAAQIGHLRTTKALLMYGANVNLHSTEERTTALIEAVREGYEEIVQILLDHGAEINYQDTDGYTALHYAVEFEHVA